MVNDGNGKTGRVPLLEKLVDVDCPCWRVKEVHRPLRG